MRVSARGDEIWWMSGTVPTDVSNVDGKTGVGATYRCAVHSPVVKLAPWSGAPRSLSIMSLARGGRCLEWHVDLVFFSILGKLGSYPIHPL
jgi:hypothetical protein